jgi:NodT family efflux transporter outer membrane factor (OMF) lipoprotein
MRRSKAVPSLLLVACLAAASCKVGPNYQRPVVDVPEAHRSDFAPESRAADRTIGDLRWWEVFHDERLTEYIGTAVQNNYSLRGAAERVVEARERLRISRADLYPTIDGTANVRSDRLSPSANALPDGTDAERFTYGAGLQMDWEIDFWGRIRRANEASFAELLATEESRREVYQSLVTSVAIAYLTLRELDLELEIARRTLGARKESVEIVTARVNRGVSSAIDLRQAEGLEAEAAATIPQTEQRIQEQENLLQFLMARNPAPLDRGRPLIDQLAAPTVPAGLPSALLDRRPDIRLAEQSMRAENARVGEAKALLYPQISLTGAAGVQSAALGDLFTRDSGFWSIPLGLVQPIFNAGRLDANVKAQQSRCRQAVLNYQSVVQGAFRETADALVRVQKTREFLVQAERLVEVSVDASRLSKSRYEGGVTTYLEVLDSDRTQFDAELQLARAHLAEMTALVDLYRSLGGGWEPENPCTIPPQSSACPPCGG